MQPINLSKPDRFDLKFLLVGDSGAGKTHFCGTYTLGPVHFYMCDPGGEKTLKKLIPDRPKEFPITITSFSPRSNTFSELWKTLQADEKAGFFKKMHDKSGLIVLPDSLTSCNDMIMREVAKKGGRTLTDESKPMRIQDWGMLIQWLKELVSLINDLPCAVASTAHLQTETDASGAIIKRYPAVNGRYAATMGSQFDEVYLLETFNKKRRIYFTEKNLFSAKSRSFSCHMLEDITMDKLATAYLEGNTLSNESK